MFPPYEVYKYLLYGSSRCSAWKHQPTTACQINLLIRGAASKNIHSILTQVNVK